MATHDEPKDSQAITARARHRRLSLTRRLTLITAVVALIGFSGFWLYRWKQRNRFEDDHALMEELRDASAVQIQERGEPNGRRDWPQWRGPRRDGVSEERITGWNWPEEGPKMLWEATTGPGYSTAAVAAGRVITMLQDGDDEAVVCWDANTGKEKWRYHYPAHFQGFQGSGPRSTPTIEGDRVYAV